MECEFRMEEAAPVKKKMSRQPLVAGSDDRGSKDANTNQHLHESRRYQQGHVMNICAFLLVIFLKGAQARTKKKTHAWWGTCLIIHGTLLDKRCWTRADQYGESASQMQPCLYE